ncbi:hypothetical protein Ocin01_20120 [Orchesella cincta]|uniref:Uncharacterized protein n=1 Tax=Orchesella cincta TaxID=48709 RepID=A0A1D2M0S3_ORCCI|nr:hypothetical protein Ocin01_20120 [Orchesella cincta]
MIIGILKLQKRVTGSNGCRSYWIKGEYCPENTGKFYWNNVEGDYCFETGTQTTPEGENVVSCYSGRVFDTWEECKAACFKGPRHHFG